LPSAAHVLTLINTQEMPKCGKLKMRVMVIRKSRPMEMTTITIPLESDLAQAYKTASAEEQEKIQILLRLFLREVAELSNQVLTTLMDTISDQAETRGLTPEILESLLDDHE
jgi:hypothetical protein